MAYAHIDIETTQTLRLLQENKFEDASIGAGRLLRLLCDMNRQMKGVNENWHLTARQWPSRPITSGVKELVDKAIETKQIGILLGFYSEADFLCPHFYPEHDDSSNIDQRIVQLGHFYLTNRCLLERLRFSYLAGKEGPYEKNMSLQRTIAKHRKYYGEAKDESTRWAIFSASWDFYKPLLTPSLIEEP